jgi:hypothetical protein
MSRRDVRNYDAILNAALERLGASTAGPIARKVDRLERFREYESRVVEERATLDAARTLATLRGPANASGGPNTRSRTRQPALDAPAGRTRSKC